MQHAVHGCRPALRHVHRVQGAATLGHACSTASDGLLCRNETGSRSLWAWRHVDMHSGTRAAAASALAADSEVHTLPRLDTTKQPFSIA